MQSPYGSKALLSVCGALMVLLAALAVVQYRWSERVAAADAQREREHLVSSAGLFATRFNDALGQAAEFLQASARPAIESHSALTNVPKLVGELYYLDIPSEGAPQAQRLDSQGRFEPVDAPQWVLDSHCLPVAIEQPPALVSPIYDVATGEVRGESGVRVLRTVGRETGRCFVARIDQSYLRDTLFPQLVRQSFGETSERDYDFAVVQRSQPGQPLFGARNRADLRQSFFSITPVRMLFPAGPPPPHRATMVVQHIESTVVTRGEAPRRRMPGDGIWDLDVARKGMPLAMAFQATRHRDLMLSVGVEALLAAAIVFVIIGARRMQRAADQKMRFVAGISHELRTPVSAISMLSRNQADGLVAGADRVKQYGELIHQQSRRLSEMVEQTLQYAGVHSGLKRPERQQIDLRQLIEDAVNDRRAELSQSGFQVEITVDPNVPAVAGDARLLRTAFENLLSNAQKHAAGGRWIRVSAVYSKPENEVRVSVEDRGAGIPEDDRSEIFEPFYRGRTAVESQIPGSGLGLSLVRSAAEAHRGTVTVVSEPGRGSTFTLHLPV